MYTVMITGAGKIGSLIACLLADSGHFEVHLADMAFDSSDVRRLLRVFPNIKTLAMDVAEVEQLQAYLEKHRIIAVISSLPFFLNPHVALAAKQAKVHYFDLTEDTEVTKTIRALAANAESAFIPQCGLAPGFVGIVAHSMMQAFDECNHAKLRVGALPQRSSNPLQYSLTWSTDGLINEYGNLCNTIDGGKLTLVKALDGLETIQIEGLAYEAFNTSGGLGHLAELYVNKVQSLNYKTIRYPGHCSKMRFLMNDLRLNTDRATLKHILERALPKTQQDLVLVYVTVEGKLDGELIEKSYLKKIYPVTIRGLEWSAIQVATAASVCAIVDLMLGHEKEYQGLVRQEQFKLHDVLANRFGRYFS